MFLHYLDSLSVEDVRYYCSMRYPALRLWLSTLPEHEADNIVAWTVDLMRMEDSNLPYSMDYHAHYGRFNLYRLVCRFAPEQEDEVWYWISEYDRSQLRRILVSAMHRVYTWRNRNK